MMAPSTLLNLREQIRMVMTLSSTNKDKKFAVVIFTLDSCMLTLFHRYHVIYVSFYQCHFKIQNIYGATIICGQFLTWKISNKHLLPLAYHQLLPLACINLVLSTTVNILDFNKSYNIYQKTKNFNLVLCMELNVIILHPMFTTLHLKHV